MQFIGRTQPYIAGPGVAGPDTLPNYGSAYAPDAGDYVPRPRDLLSQQGASRSRALRRQQFDFLLPGNRLANIGGQFNPTAASGFQMPGNQNMVAPMNAGLQLSDINTTPLATREDILNGAQPVMTTPLPQQPYLSGAGMGFMLPGNRPKTIRTGGAGQASQA